MNIKLKSLLLEKIQQFLDENEDDIGDLEGIWQDNTTANRNAALMTNAAEVVIDSMRLQSELDRELNG